MGLLSKLKLPPLPASSTKPGRVTIAGPDATDGRRTRLDLDDDTADNGAGSFVVRALDDEHPEAAGANIAAP